MSVLLMHQHFFINVTFWLQCEGDESSLTQCPHEGWDTLNSGYSNSWYCRGHYDDAGVYCYGHGETLTITGLQRSSRSL